MMKPRTSKHIIAINFSLGHTQENISAVKEKRQNLHRSSASSKIAAQHMVS